MNFVILILLWMVIQILPSILANPLPKNSYKENFLDFYENELFLMAANFSEKFKNTSENLLSTKELQEAATPELKEFKNSLNHYLQDYPHFKRFKLQPILLMTLINLQDMEGNEMDKEQEIVIKFKELFQKHFKSLLKEYDENYTEFIKGKFSNKFEDLKKHFESKEFQNITELNNYIDILKSCRNYKCFPQYIDPILLKLNITDELQLKYFKRDYKQYATLILIRFNTVGQRMLKSEKLLKLSSETRNTLICDVNNFKTILEESDDIEQFINSITIAPSFPQKYLNNSNLPLEDREIIDDVMKEYKASLGDNIYEKLSVGIMVVLALKIAAVSLFLGGNQMEDLRSIKEYLDTF
ncbi:uncharacterized protein ACRADG_004364 [Cochliomyia hominivorax]